jgi:hypothetical protein
MKRYAAEPLITNTEYIFLNRERDIENARDFFVSDRGEVRSLDPRLIDPVRNIRMALDRPPYQPRNVQPLQNMYSDCKDRIAPRVYTQGYESIYPGDIQYYIDPSQAQAYDNPEYAVQQAVVPFVFQDPMGALKPQYDRVPLYKNNQNISDYTFDQDQIGFREDMITRLQRTMNQTDYQLFAGHFLPGH